MFWENAGSPSIGMENMSTMLGSIVMGWKYEACLGLAASTASILDRERVGSGGKRTKSARSKFDMPFLQSRNESRSAITDCSPWERS